MESVDENKPKRSPSKILILSKLSNLINDKYPEKKEKKGSLFEMFSSDFFSIEFVLEYLLKREEPTIIDFLVNLLFTQKYLSKSFFYLPQLLSLTRYKKYFQPIEDFIISQCAEDTMFAVTSHWILNSYLKDPKINSKQFNKFLENIETFMINGAKNKNKLMYQDDNFYIEKQAKLKQFDNTLNFFRKLKALCLKLKNLTLPPNIEKECGDQAEALKHHRRSYLINKLWDFNQTILSTFPQSSSTDKQYLLNNQYIGFILPFDMIKKKVIVNFLSEQTFFYTTKERNPIKITVECVDAEDLYNNNELENSKEEIKKSLEDEKKEKEDRDKNILGDLNKIRKNSTTDNIPFAGDNFKKEKELTKEEKEKLKKIINKIKYENEHPGEILSGSKELSSIEMPEPLEKFGDKLNPFNTAWKEKELKIISQSSFKRFKSLSIVSFIAKAHDDLRQEAMTMQLIKKFYEIFKEENIPLRLRPYEIIITSASSGLVEYIPDTISMDSLKKKLVQRKMTFDEFFIQHFGDEFEESQKIFTESVAAYSLISYLIAIKDRHNGNILLHKNGALIHIDFGFVLGISPGGNMNFENAPFKMTKDYLRVMGGADSSIYEYFKSLFLKGLFAVRKHVDLFSNIVEIMGVGVPMPCFNGRNLKDVVNNFRDRFLLKYSETEIVGIVQGLIDKSLNSWRTAQYDYFQKLTNDIQP